jgi:hypothetical protein
MGNMEGIILVIVAVIAAVLLDMAWMWILRRLRSKSKTGEAPAEAAPPAADPFRSWISQFTKGWLDPISRWAGLQGGASRWIRPLLLILTVLLAAIPSAVVMLDRWFNLSWAENLLEEVRGVSPFLDALPLPGYFVLFLLVLLAAGALIAFFPLDERAFADVRTGYPPADGAIPAAQIRISQLLRWIALTEFIAVAAFRLAANELPGIELLMVAGLYVAGWVARDFPLSPVWRAVRDNRDVLFACLLAHVALLLVLTACHACPGCLPAAAVCLGLALLHLFPYRKRVPAIYWIFSLALILFSINVNAWWMTVVGDEYGFYDSARAIADRLPLAEIASRFFDELGVFGFNPYLASVVQAAFLKLFGTQGFGWRFSNIYLVALAVPFAYLFLKTFLDRRIALLAAFFLACSHYLINFSKIGYVNLQALFLMCVSLAAAAWAVRSGRTAAFALCGAVLAMNFYVYGVALATLPLALLLLLWYAPPFSRAALRCWLVLAAGFGILFFPLYFQPDFWERGFGFTIFGYAEAAPDTIGVGQFLSYRFLTSWFSYLYSSNESHFVAVSFVDGITAALVGIGFFVVLFRLRRHRFSSFFLLGWICLLTVAGIIGSPDRPSTTRMFMLLPWWTAAAALGLWWIRERILAAGAPGAGIARVWTGGFLLLVAAVNVVNAVVIARLHWLDFQTFESAVEGVTEWIHPFNTYAERKFVFLTTVEYDLAPFLMFREVYPQFWGNVELEKVGVDGPQLPESVLSVESNFYSVLFLMPALPEEWKEDIGTALESAGYYRCPLHLATERGPLELFVPNDKAWLCPDSL